MIVNAENQEIYEIEIRDINGRRRTIVGLRSDVRENIKHDIDDGDDIVLVKVGGSVVASSFARIITKDDVLRFLA